VKKGNVGVEKRKERSGEETRKREQKNLTPSTGPGDDGQLREIWERSVLVANLGMRRGRGGEVQAKDKRQKWGREDSIGRWPLPNADSHRLEAYVESFGLVCHYEEVGLPTLYM